jgi:hypothetical protein
LLAAVAAVPLTTETEVISLGEYVNAHCTADGSLPDVELMLRFRVTDPPGGAEPGERLRLSCATAEKMKSGPASINSNARRAWWILNDGSMVLDH